MSSFLDTVFPEALPQVQLGQLEKGAADDLSKRFADSLFPERLCSFVFGSITGQTYKPWSDVDILIVLPTTMRAEKRCVVYEGVPIECYVYDPILLDAAFSTPNGWAGPLLVAAVREGYVLDDSGKLTEKLRACCQRFAQERKRLAPSETPDFVRARITSLLVELVTNSDSWERTSVASAAMEALLSEVVLRETGFRNAPKWTARIFQNAHRELADRLHRSYRTFIADGTVEPFLSVCESILGQLGGATWNGYVGPVR